MRAISLVEKRQITKRTEVVNATVVMRIPLVFRSAVRSDFETLPAPVPVFWVLIKR